jgi:3D (Asp-Asp-Asp) domain-containing protein
MIDAQEQKIQQLKDLLSFAVNQDYTDFEFNTLKVTATAYTARKEECNSEPWITASGTPSRVGVIAISRDLERVGVNLGDFVIVKGMGLFRVEDRMNKRWEKRIDILHANLEAARRFSKRKVEILWFDDTKIARQEEPQSEPLG